MKYLTDERVILNMHVPTNCANYMIKIVKINKI